MDGIKNCDIMFGSILLHTCQYEILLLIGVMFTGQW